MLRLFLAGRYVCGGFALLRQMRDVFASGGAAWCSAGDGEDERATDDYAVTALDRADLTQAGHALGD
jgi:hypothetical protein